MPRAFDPSGRRSFPRRVVAFTAAAVLAVLGAAYAASHHALRAAATAVGGAGFTLDSLRPSDDATLLFLDGRPTVPLADGRRAVVTEDGILRVADRRLRLTPLPLPALRGTMVSVAPARDGEWWISSREGSLQRVDSLGRSRRFSRAPFAASALWPLENDGVLASRSPERFSFEPEPAGAPVLVALDAQERSATIGTARRPAHELLTSVANAGYVVALGDTAYFAPLGRSELVAMRFDGRKVWERVETQAIPTPEPRFDVGSGEVRVDYQPYNLGLTIGPDRLLYRLRAVDTAMTAVALDIIDPVTGAVHATRALGGARATLALDDHGRLHLLDIGRLLDAAVPSEREALPSFALPMRAAGDSVTLTRYTGKVLLLNFWASWCAPCRTEMPALDSLRGELSGDDRFAMLAMNADVDGARADAFLTQHKLELPVAYGGPALQSRYRYPGLPYTILVDAEGRVIRRWIGQLQSGDLLTIKTLVRMEHLRGTDASPTHGMSHMHHMPANTP